MTKSRKKSSLHKMAEAHAPVLSQQQRVASEILPLRTSWRDIALAVLTLLTLLVGSWNFQNSNRLDNADRARADLWRQSAVTEKNLGQIWDAGGIRRPYKAPDWQRDAGEVDAAK